MDYVGELERIVAELYSYRWFFLGGGLVVVGATCAFGYLRDWHLAICGTGWLLVGWLSSYWWSPYLLDGT